MYNLRQIRYAHLLIGILLMLVGLLAVYDMASMIELLILALGVAALVRGLSFVALYVQSRQDQLTRTPLLVVAGIALAAGGIALIVEALVVVTPNSELRLWMVRLIAALIAIDAGWTLLLARRTLLRPRSPAVLLRYVLSVILLLMAGLILVLSLWRPDALPRPIAIALLLSGLHQLVAGLLLAPQDRGERPSD